MNQSIVEPPVGKQPRFSGHESFACRYAWLPKAYLKLKEDPDLFHEDENAMLQLGLGKNMVRSLKFWVEAVGMATPVGRTRTMAITQFGDDLFAEDGVDPFIEDPKTQWLLHWKLASHHQAPLFAWEFLIGRWPFPEFTRSEAMKAFKRESEKLGASHSDVTLGQHLDVFMHTYLPTRSGVGVGIEDSLDGPLVDLNFVTTMGMRQIDERTKEPIFAFRREEKPEITDALFDYCIMDYWDRFSPQESTLPFRTVASAPSSPGQVFKLTEDDVRARLEERRGDGREAPYSFQASAVQGMLTRNERPPKLTLAQVYERDDHDG
ncbi:DUF4007 family protein [Caulobacter endophyticus]|uniref:DUF4007 domain-containing protein n=1 Tax=Caulobacter endophyticus TaxID=2172652 RepID=A0A2T9K427_9CAUL|nr:DUF4007 family protein [Caulobacter endophyticus]PVM90694.1 DUF4007 domain-containing protein [Caulobacter endophyticus]